MEKRYITLCNSEKYIRGTLVMYESLNASGTTIPLVVFCPKKTPERVRQILKDYAALCSGHPCRMEILESEEDVVLPAEVTENNKWLRWNGTFDKLLVFGLTQYDKLVFVDSDMLVLRNIDGLFDRPHMSACFDGQYDKHNLNSGLMVIEPTGDQAEIDRIMSLITEVIHHPEFGDQDVIRLAFPEWKTNGELHLPESYNMFFENAARRKMEEGYDLAASAADPMYIIHFIGYDKPWYGGRHPKWKVYNFLWKTRMCLRCRKTYHNDVTEKILRRYQCARMKVNRKLRKLKTVIYEMK